MKTRKISAWVALAAATSLAMTACSSAGTEDAETGSTQAQTLKVTFDGTSSGAAIQLGIDQGFFEEEGLNIELTANGTPPAAAAALQSNQVDIASIPVIPALNAQEQGIKITSIAPVAGYPDDVTADSEFDTYGVYVDPNSGIESPKDLAGKQVAVPARKAIFEAFVYDAVMRDGGDPTTIEWIALDFGSQVESLKTGRIDAAAVPLPFTFQIEANGGEMLWSPGVAFYEKGVTSSWMASPDTVKDRETVQKFQRAIIKSNAYANEHTDEAIKAASEMTGIDEQLIIDGGKFNYFNTELNPEDLVRVSEKMVEIGFLTKPMEVNENTIITD